MFLMTATSAVLSVGPMFVIFSSDSYITFLEQFSPHAVICKLALYVQIPWVRRRLGRLFSRGGAVAPAPEGPAVGAALGGRLKTVKVVDREQVRCTVGAVSTLYGSSDRRLMPRARFWPSSSQH